MHPRNKELMILHLRTIEREINRMPDSEEEPFDHELNWKLIGLRGWIREKMDSKDAHRMTHGVGNANSK